MGRNAKRKRADPLHPRASRVEKVRRERDTLPSWYYRVLGLRWDHEPFAPDDPRDFDEDLSELEDLSEREDLSELEEQSQQEEKAEHLQEEAEKADGAEECECAGEDSDCDCQLPEDDDTDDSESERSYDGSDADYYYDLKEQREQRKREKLEERMEKDEYLEFEKSKEKEVRAAYESLREAEKKNNTTPVTLSLSGEGFNLFCSDHVEHLYDSDFYAAKRLFFHTKDCSGDEPDGPDVTKTKPGNETDLYGSVTFDGDVEFDFGPFRPPTYASGKPVKVESVDEEHELSFHFIGNGYLKLRVSRDMVFFGTDSHPEGPPTTAPEYFDFVGIWRDPEKEKAERERILKEERARRPPSPRESWFELNHPMGYWRSGF